jgi:hypothetical protein
MIPVVMPDSSMAGLPRALANRGTKGGLHTAATDVMTKVSPSTRASLHNKRCSKRLPSRPPNRKVTTSGLTRLNSSRVLRVATAKQNT